MNREKISRCHRLNMGFRIEKRTLCAPDCSKFLPEVEKICTTHEENVDLKVLTLRVLKRYRLR
jgi:hypothetical protein